MCDKHPRYTGKRKPRTTCPFCYELYTMMSPTNPPEPDNVREFTQSQADGFIRDNPDTDCYCPERQYYEWYSTAPCPHLWVFQSVKCEYKKCKLECKPTNQFLIDRGIYPCLKMGKE